MLLTGPLQDAASMGEGGWSTAWSIGPFFLAGKKESKGPLGEDWAAAANVPATTSTVLRHENIGDLGIAEPYLVWNGHKEES